MNTEGDTAIMHIHQSWLILHNLARMYHTLSSNLGQHVKPVEVNPFNAQMNIVTPEVHYVSPIWSASVTSEHDSLHKCIGVVT